MDDEIDKRRDEEYRKTQENIIINFHRQINEKLESGNAEDLLKLIMSFEMYVNLKARI